MFKSAADEISQWADQCRRWALGARTREQRLTLQSLETLLNQAAGDAGLDLEMDSPRPLAPKKF
jgi:hypothetical protein